MGNEEHRTRSSAQLPQVDPAHFQLLYEFERRMGDLFKDARVQNKEDIANALLPVNAKLDAMGTRLANGDARFERHEGRLDDHSDRLAKPQTGSNDTAALTKKSKGGWISVDKLQALIVGIISAVIAGAVSIIVAMKAMPTTMPTSPAPSTVSQPGTPP